MRFIAGAVVAIGLVLLRSAINGRDAHAMGQQTFTQSGWPSVAGDGRPVVAWRSCPAKGGCRRVRPDVRSSDLLELGPTASGTRFEADVRDDDGGLSVLRSSPWRGQVTAVSDPGIRGSLRAGSLIRPVKARWSGGWPGDVSRLSLEACRTGGRSACVTLSSAIFATSCGGAAGRPGSEYVGWRLRAVDRRVPRNASTSAVGFSEAKAIPVEPHESSSDLWCSSLSGLRRLGAGRGSPPVPGRAGCLARERMRVILGRGSGGR
jgi:hypothetical protein